ncbi:MAG: cation diffusion facilitator family transporter, partial [Longimicrobiales bacterium]
MPTRRRLDSDRASPTHYAWISILAATSTILLKGGAFALTGSVGLFADALESFANLAAAVVALLAIAAALRPADEEHAYGHTKAEYFASGFEGALVLAAAVVILILAVPRLFDPRPIEEVGIGLVIMVGASVINLSVARVLLRAAQRLGSIALDADARHLLTDVWTTAGVIIGVGAAALTGWARVDAIIAIAVALHVTRTGASLVHRSAMGLLDTALPDASRSAIHDVLVAYEAEGVSYHALRTRQAASRRFISFHVLVPGEWSVQRGHDLVERIEAEIRAVVPNSTV